MMKHLKRFDEKSLIGKLFQKDNEISQIDDLDDVEKMYRISYTIPKNWYNSSLDVVENTLLVLRIEKIIISSKIVKMETDSVNYKYFCEVKSLLRKKELQHEIDNRSTRIEKIIVEDETSKEI